MRWLQVLRAILNFLYFFGWMSAVSCLIIPIMIYNGVPTIIEGISSELIENDILLYTAVVTAITGYFFYLAMIYHLKKAVYLINPKRLLSARLQTHLYKAGLFCVIAGVLTKVIPFIFKYLIAPFLSGYKSHYGVELNMTNGFDSILVILTFGIFLIIFSKIIERSLILQKENSLTI